MMLSAGGQLAQAAEKMMDKDMMMKDGEMMMMMDKGRR
jgi:hypothetical protein